MVSCFSSLSSETLNTANPPMQQYTSPLCVEERDASVAPDSALAELRPTLCNKDSDVVSALAGVAPPDTGVESSTNSAYNVNPPSVPASRLPSPGLVTPPPFVSQFFYETFRNTQPPPVSSQTPSSTGATRDANSHPDTHALSTPPLTPMSVPRDPRGDDPQRSPALSSPVDVPAHHPARHAAPRRSFQRQSFPPQPYYPPRNSEPPFPAPGPYPSAPPFMGQYMPTQSYAYSQPFSHPGIHAPDPGAMGIPFSAVPLPPPINRGFGYQSPPGADALPGDSQDSISAQAYAPPPSSHFVSSPTAVPAAPPPATPRSGQHVSHHPTYTPLHFSPSPSAPHYHGYPTHSYPHSPPGIYSYPPSPYQQSYYSPPPAFPEDASKAGTWWYMSTPTPAGGQQYDSPPYRGGYYPPTMRPEYDPYPPLSAGPSGQPQQPTIRPPPRESSLHPSSPVAPRPSPSNPGPSPNPGPGAPPPTSVPMSPHEEPPSPVAPRKEEAATSPASPASASRKSYHPNPPTNRSEWVMWVGNVPSDATYDELYNFFNQPAPVHPLPPGTSAIMSSRHVQPPPPVADKDKGKGKPDLWRGVSSVFVIARSNCAFVNYETEEHLECAVAHFNGKPVRPRDPRCPRLVCRVRRRDDDLRAGVGGQRGIGLHTRWVAEQREREREREQEREPELKTKKNKRGPARKGEAAEEEADNIDGPPMSPSTYPRPSSPSDPSLPYLGGDELPPVRTLSRQGSLDDKDALRHGSSGDRSFASTNSSFLATHFPKRYFILKSLTQHDLNLSVERGVWATQPHNEGILDQAYRTSLEVYLIFGANKSGEFFGYAKMVGPVFHSERVDHVSWASRPSASVSSGGGHRGSSPPEAIAEEDESDKKLLSPSENRMVDESPAPVTPDQEARLQAVTAVQSTSQCSPQTGGDEGKLLAGHASAPAELRQPQRQISRPTLPREAETYPESLQKVGEDRPRQKAMSDGSQFTLRLPPPRGVGAVKTPMTTEKDVGRKWVPPLKDADGVLRMDTYISDSDQRRMWEGRQVVSAPAIPAVIPGSDTPPEQQNAQDPERREGSGRHEGWGREFKVEWMRTDRLPFHRTRHLRNPWNHDREVKVSRDGTELEPSVGQRLLDEWDAAPPASQAEASPPTSPISVRGGGHGSSRGPIQPGGNHGDGATSAA